MEINERLDSLEKRVDAIESQMLGRSRDDVPPEPRKTGRKYVGSKFDLRVRIDSNLFQLLEQDARENHGRNLSKALDAILWRHYGKPRLSFEGGEE
jgi:hypothetical protein